MFGAFILSTLLHINIPFFKNCFSNRITQLCHQVLLVEDQRGEEPERKQGNPEEEDRCDHYLPTNRQTLRSFLRNNLN